MTPGGRGGKDTGGKEGGKVERRHKMEEDP